MVRTNNGLVQDPRPLALQAMDWPSELAFGGMSFDEIPMEGGIEEEVLDEIINIDQDGPYCTGAAPGYGIEGMQFRETGRMVQVSKVDLYNHNKLIDGLPAGTDGSTVWASVETARVVGAIYEYIVRSTAMNIGPPHERTESEKAIGRFNSIKAYVRCNTFNDLLIALANKYPVVFGLYLFESFFDAPGGRVPRVINGRGVGGHEMCAMRYSLSERWVKVPQSWGINAKLTDPKGCQYIPFEWFTTLMDGRWPILGDMYALLDFIPAGATRLPKTLTVLPEIVRVRVNGVDVDLNTLQIPPFIASNIGKTFVYIRDLAPIVAAMLKAAGHHVTPAVEWNQKDRAVEFKV